MTVAFKGMAIVIGILSAAGVSLAADNRSDIKIVDRAVIPENVTSAKDGSIYVGSFESGGIYRAGPGERTASLWVKSDQLDSGRALGLWIDDRDDQLLVCVIPKPSAGETKPQSSSIRVFGLKDAAVRADYALDAGGICNDITVATDGTMYTTDMAGRILRLHPGEPRFGLWFEDARRLMAADGLALMAHGGRLTELTISHSRATMRIIRDGIVENSSGITLMGRTAYVSLANWAARRNPSIDKGEFTVLAIPYRK